MKKSLSLVNYCIFLFCTIIYFSLNSCSKENEEPKVETISLSPEKSQYAPYEIVTITATDIVFTAQTFSAKINNTEIIIGSNDNSASFVLPNLSNGKYDLSFTLNNKNYIVPITISSMSNVLSADVYFNDVKTGINQNITNLNSQITQLEQDSTIPNEYENLKNDVIKYTNLLNNYIASYNNLSVAEKQEFAKTMAANKVFIDENNNNTAALNSSTASLRTAQTVLDYEKGVEISKGAFVTSVIFTVAHIPAMITAAKLIASPVPWVSAGAVIATGLIFTSYCINLDETITASQKLTTKAIKPFEFLTSTTQTVYNSGFETLSDIQAKYKSLTDSDSSSSGATINTIIEKYTFFRTKINGFVNVLPAIFRPTYVITSLKSTYKNASKSIYNKYISITNNSNPNVTLLQLNQTDGSIKIKATTTASTDQSFTYDVNYTNSNFTNGLKKTVSAKVIVAVDSIAIYRASVVGNWRIESYTNGGTLYYVQHKILSENGDVLIIKNSPVGGIEESFSPPKYQESWAIAYNNSGYHLVINGTVYPYVLKYPVRFIDGGLPPYPNYVYNKE